MDLPFVRERQQRRQWFLEAIPADGHELGPRLCGLAKILLSRETAALRSAHLSALQTCCTSLTDLQKGNRQMSVQIGIRRESQT